MDVAAVLAIIALLAAMIVPIFFLFRTQAHEKAKEDAVEAANNAREAAAIAKKQAKLERGQGKKKKGALSRMKKGGSSLEVAEPAVAAVGGRGADSGSDDDDDDDVQHSRKDARKADKRAEHREQVEARNAQLEAVREKESEKDAKRRAREAEREAKALAREEAEREAAEALAKAKQEEFEQWKGMFSVEGSGEEGASGGDDEGLLPRFVAYMREHKVSVLEELAPAFGLRVAEVVERVSALERMGLLSGVVDDRGKFIYITHEEMAAVAKYVQRKGRVRISTLAMESNKLIDLAPKKLEEDDDDADAQGDREVDAAAAAQPG